MPANAQDLAINLTKLIGLASEASKLAQAERMLADKQHLVAHNLELLADNFASQVRVVEAEIKALLPE